MAVYFTKAFVKSLKPSGRVREVMDPSLPGFGLRVHPSGRMTWIYRYRTMDGRLRRISLGAYADSYGVSLVEARESYYEQKRIRDTNGDPLEERERNEIEAKTKRENEAKRWTVKQLLWRFASGLGRSWRVFMTFCGDLGVFLCCLGAILGWPRGGSRRSAATARAAHI